MKRNPKRLSLAKETLRMISGSAVVVGVEGSSVQPVEPVKTEKTWACDTVYDCTVTYRITCV